MTTQTFIGQLVIIECSECSMLFGISKQFSELRRMDHRRFFCPAGHHQYFVQKTEAEMVADDLAAKLRRETELRFAADRQYVALQDQLEATEHSLAGHKAAKTRLKKRIAAGVCPCCNRSFQNVSRHMSGQHPEFTRPELDPQTEEA